MRLDKTSLHIVNLTIALVISLIINFSYFFMWINSSTAPAPLHHAYGNMVFETMTVMVLYQVLYYFLISYGLLTVFFIGIKNENHKLWHRLVLCLLLSVIFYFFSPLFARNDNVIFTFQARRVLNPSQALKASFILVVTALYASIYRLSFKQQHILLENEQLKNENLETRYDMLVSQINPHFFFNSLNSLSMLVRTDNKSQALNYIDNLSDTFRYILKNGQQGVVTLKDELSFTQSYKYLHEIRYADKLFIDINVDNSLFDKKLPSMSLQPLIENAVKHNVISSEQKFVISIYVENKYLCVSNPVREKIEKSSGLGIGLENMSLRYKLLINKDIEVINSPDTFTVKLPLT